MRPLRSGVAWLLRATGRLLLADGDTSVALAKALGHMAEWVAPRT